MKITDVKAVQELIRTCTDGWEQGWHEGAAGSLSYRMRPAEAEKCRALFRPTPGPWVKMEVRAGNLQGEHFLVTGGGKRFRNVARYPENNVGILEINEEGDAWRVLWGLEHGGRPTGEFPLHFLCHSVRREATDGAARVVYHACPPYLEALAAILPLDSRELTRTLWKSGGECLTAFPEGIGVAPWTPSPSLKAARALGDALKYTAACLWAGRGLVASGPDFDAAFSLAYVAEKAARVRLLALAAKQGEPLRELSDGDLRALARASGVSLREDFLE